MNNNETDSGRCRRASVNLQQVFGLIEDKCVEKDVEDVCRFYGFDAGIELRGAHLWLWAVFGREEGEHAVQA